jgi:hypothetical protein
MPLSSSKGVDRLPKARTLFLSVAAMLVAGIVLGGAPAFSRSSGGELSSPPTLRASAGCTADATIALVRVFVASYSKGRLARLEAFWAPAGRFHWFSTGPPGKRLGRSAYDRSTLEAYFRMRVLAHERIRLVEVRAGYSAARDLVDFSGKLIRSADDRPAPRAPQDFKGAADCVSGSPRLIVWSM